MSNQRRIFLRNVAITSIGIPFFANTIFASSDLNKSNSYKSNITITNSNLTELNILKQYQDKGYTIDFENQFKLNSNCKAFPIKKTSRLFKIKNELLLIVDNNHYALSEKQQLTYNKYITNFSSLIKDKSDKMLSVAEIVTPYKIVKSEQPHIFRFTNNLKNTIEIDHKKKCVRFV